jgi:DNA-binding FadR family transcriptional regulator
MERKAPQSYAAIHAAVFDRIVQGHYRPTHRIGIAALAETLGVSTTPVREALRQLAGRDLVVERHREGFYLAPLNARAIVSLYRAHGHWMDRALALLRGGSQVGRQYRNLWRLFDAAATHSSDVALIAVRRYLDDRLIVLRRYEAQAVGDFAERGGLLAQALAAQDFAAAQAISAAFHERCAERADQLASGFDPNA